MPSQITTSDLERTEELFRFLQGTAPKGFYIREGHMPRLDADQAWTVIWYLGNLYWQVTDFIERCDRCGDLYNSECEGMHREVGTGEGEVSADEPHGHRCEGCLSDFDSGDRGEW